MQEEIEIQVPAEKKLYGELKKNLIKNTAFNFLTSIIGRLGGLIFTILIARFLQPELFGVFTLATSVMLIAVTFADLGINATLLRYIALALGKKDNKKAASYFRYLFKIKIILTFIFAFIIIVIAYPISFYIFKQPQIFYPILLCSVYLVFLSLIGFYESLFYAVHKAKYVSIKEIIWQILRIVSVITCIYIISDKVIGAIAGIIFALILTFIFSFWIAKKNYPTFFKKSDEISKQEKKKILSFLFFLTIGSITAIFFGYIDIVMLGIFVKPEFVGFYRAAFTIVGSVASIITISNVLLPIFTQLEGKKLEDIFNKVFKYSAILSFPAAFGLILVAKPFINIIYGSSYLLSSVPLYLLSFLIIESSTGSLFLWLFAARGKPEIPTRILIIATFINIFLTYVLITSMLNFGPIYAVLGASAAILISRYFNFIMLIKEARKKFNVRLYRSNVTNPLIASIIMLFSLIIFQHLTKFIWPLSIIEIIFAILVYCTAIFLIGGITKEDLNMLKLLIKKAKAKEK